MRRNETMFGLIVKVIFQSPSELDSTELVTYQTNMERILRWILQLENELDQQGTTISTDLKTIKVQFQKHEVIIFSSKKNFIEYCYSRNL